MCSVRVLALALALCSSCGRSRSLPTTSGAPSSSGSPGAAQLAPAPSASASSAALDAGRSLFTELPVLDRAKGEQAVAAYRHRYDEFCAGRVKLLAPQVNAGATPLCPRESSEGKALASGSFVEPNADEVLVEGSTGYSWAQGDMGLFLLRRTGAEYRVVRLLQPGHQFEARMRLHPSSGVDVLVLCHVGGHMGTYPGVCGFFGRDSFAPGDVEPYDGDQTEVPFLDVHICGPSFSSRILAITLDGDRLHFKLSVEEFESRRGPKDEDGRYDCNERVNVRAQSFEMDFRFDGKRFRRLTPVPQPIVRALAKWG